MSFTQSGVATFFGNGVPMGHEWVTRLSALELLGDDPIIGPDPKDPRNDWDRGFATNLDLSSPGAQAEVRRIKANGYSDWRYQSTYKVVYDAMAKGDE